MKDKLKNLVLQEEAQTMAEYAVVAFFFAVALAGVNEMMRTAAASLFNRMSGIMFGFGGAGIRL